ncbi:hypothetical protein DRO24_01390 [Candidatus Bathyarchaeota archaeon]|nr:MAG: hypothetical protein DRO24_01390 [Candidatus Bathyarchaeota archaeon]
MANKCGVLRTQIYNWRRLEEKGREIISKEYKNPRVQYYDIITWARALIEKLAPIVNKARECRMEDEGSALHMVALAARFMTLDAKDCVFFGTPPKKCEVSTPTKTYLHNIDHYCKKILGRKCTWLLGVKEPYTLTAAVNDLDASFHSLMERVEKQVEEIEDVSDKCTSIRGDEALKEACKAWDEETEKWRKNRKYAEVDYEELSGMVVDKKAEFRVGSAGGHKAHIDLEKGTLEYYDDDMPVNYLMSKLMEDIGLKCEYHDEGVSCKGVNRENVKEVARRLAAATSMDFRLNCDYLGREPPGLPKCDPLHPWSNVDREYRAVSWKLTQKLLEEFT